jgi:hypothetical protein
MEKKDFVCIRLTKSSEMTVKATIGRMCHDIRATRPGYLRDDPDAKCYWFPEKSEGIWKMKSDPLSVKEVSEYLHRHIADMKKRYEEMPRGENGHFQRAKINTRWFMQGILIFSKEQLQEVSTFDILINSTRFLDVLAEKLKTKVVWAGFHDDETTLHLQFGLENLDSEAHTIQRRINKRVDQPERNHLMTTNELQDMAGEHFKELGFRRGISRDVTGAKHKEVRDVFRIEQAELIEKKGALITDLLDLYDGKNVVSDLIKDKKKKLRSLNEEYEKLNNETRSIEEANKKIAQDLERKRTEADSERQFFEEEVEKYRRLKESEKAMKMAAMTELDRRERASEKELAVKAREYEMESTFMLLKRLTEHADGCFTLHTKHRRFYSGTEVWGTPERVSVADFVKNYPEMKEKNVLGYEYMLGIIGTPPLFCLDGVEKHELERMPKDGITPFAVVESSPGSYQAWIQLKSEDKAISSGSWNSIMVYLEDKYGAKRKSSNKRPYFALPGFLSYTKDHNGSLATLHLTEGASDVPMKSVTDVMEQIPENIKKTTSPEVHTGDTRYPNDSVEAAASPGWFVEKWDDDRADLINSKRCPKRKDGTPDDSLIDFVVAKNLISYYSSHRHEVLQERIGYCYQMLARDADDPQRLHRKMDPCGYAKKTVNSVLRSLGLREMLHEDAQKDYSR